MKTNGVVKYGVVISPPAIQGQVVLKVFLENVIRDAVTYTEQNNKTYDVVIFNQVYNLVRNRLHFPECFVCHLNELMARKRIMS